MQIRLNTLRRVIREALLLERKRDLEYLELAKQIFNELVQGVSSVSGADFTTPDKDGEHGMWGLMTIPMKQLGVTSLPNELNDLVFGIRLFDDPGTGSSDDGLSIEPGVSPLFPGGLVYVAYSGAYTGGGSDTRKSKYKNIMKWHAEDSIDSPIVNKSKATQKARRLLAQTPIEFSNTDPRELSSVQIMQLLQARRGVVVHELVHLFDTTIRNDVKQMQRNMRKRLEEPGNLYTQDPTKYEKQRKDDDNYDLRHYFTSEHEINAYILQTCEDTVQDFLDSIRSAKPTQKRAKRWAGDSTKTYDRFRANVYAGIPQFVGDDKLMRRAAARFKAFWDKYVASLPEQ